MENFEKKREILLREVDTERKLLLHSCCAPCSSSVLARLIAENFQIAVYYYNPNVDGAEEYELRRSEQARLIREAFPEVGLIAEPHCEEDFEKIAAGYEDAPEGGARCERCFRLRLRALAEKAKELGYPLICTTLTVSPLKNASLLNRIGEEEAARAGVLWLPSDFKKQNGYSESIELSKQYGLYRQNFCGCRFSKRKEQ